MFAACGGPSTGPDRTSGNGGDAGTSGEGGDQDLGGDDDGGTAANLPVKSTTLAMGYLGGCEIYDSVATQGLVRCWGSPGLFERWPSEGGFVQVDANDVLACALRADGSGVCFTSNGVVDIPSEHGPYAQVSVTNTDVCLLSRTGEVNCYAGLYSEPFAELMDLGFPAGPYVDISAHGMTEGSLRFCAVSDAGTVSCWVREGSSFAAPPEDLTNVRSVDVGTRAACALSDAGAVTCWGDVPVLDPADAAGPYEKITMGDPLCALSSSGAVSCWNRDGVIEVASQLEDAQEIAAIQEISYGRHEPVVCAKDSSDNTRCTGLNAYGSELSPYEVGAIAEVKASHQYVCVRNEQGAARCTSWSHQPSPGLPPFVQIAAAYDLGCGVTTAGEVACWGYYAEAAELDAPDFLGTATQVAVGVSGICALAYGGRPVCWASPYGSPSVGEGYVQIEAGSHSACVRRDSGEVTCWKVSSTHSISPPVGLVATDIGVGMYHAIALTDAGQIRCWGVNDEGQTDIPSDLVDATGFRDVDAGGETSCVVLADGNLRCWGNYVPTIEGLDIASVSVDEDTVCVTTTANNVFCASPGETMTIVTAD